MSAAVLATGPTAYPEGTIEPKTAISTLINQRDRPRTGHVDLIWARFSDLQLSLGGFGRSGFGVARAPSFVLRGRRRFSRGQPRLDCHDCRLLRHAKGRIPATIGRQAGKIEILASGGHWPDRQKRSAHEAPSVPSRRPYRPVRRAASQPIMSAKGLSEYSLSIRSACCRTIVRWFRTPLSVISPGID
jgi:hypothetical protein